MNCVIVSGLDFEERLWKFEQGWTSISILTKDVFYEIYLFISVLSSLFHLHRTVHNHKLRLKYRKIECKLLFFTICGNLFEVKLLFFEGGPNFKQRLSKFEQE